MSRVRRLTMTSATAKALIGNNPNRALKADKTIPSIRLSSTLSHRSAPTDSRRTENRSKAAILYLGGHAASQVIRVCLDCEDRTHS